MACNVLSNITECSKFVNHSGQYILSTILLCYTVTVCEVRELMCDLCFFKGKCLFITV